MSNAKIPVYACLTAVSVGGQMPNEHLKLVSVFAINSLPEIYYL
jgi:hypothetical protein